MLIRKSFFSVALILLATCSFGAVSFAASAVAQVSSVQAKTKPRKPLHNTSRSRQATSTTGDKHGKRSMIFVGGKERSQGAATKSNPTRATKSNGTLNPQPIPPGRQRQP